MIQRLVEEEGENEKEFLSLLSSLYRECTVFLLSFQLALECISLPYPSLSALQIESSRESTSASNS